MLRELPSKRDGCVLGDVRRVLSAGRSAVGRQASALQEDRICDDERRTILVVVGEAQEYVSGGGWRGVGMGGSIESERAERAESIVAKGMPCSERQPWGWLVGEAASQFDMRG